MGVKTRVLGRGDSWQTSGLNRARVRWTPSCQERDMRAGSDGTRVRLNRAGDSKKELLSGGGIKIVVIG
jgi:hypothetical protein